MKACSKKSLKRIIRNIVLIVVFSLCIITIFYTRNYQEKAAKEKGRILVQLSYCVDGDTAYFYNESIGKQDVRFLGINSPELDENLGEEAKNYTCNALSNAQKIEIQPDTKAGEKDKYDRYLYWVFVDDTLLQASIIENGYAEIKYVYGEYLYLDELKKAQEEASRKELGVFSPTYTPSLETATPEIIN